MIWKSWKHNITLNLLYTCIYVCVCVGIKNIKFELNIRLPIKASNLYLQMPIQILNRGLFRRLCIHFATPVCLFIMCNI